MSINYDRSKFSSVLYDCTLDDLETISNKFSFTKPTEINNKFVDEHNLSEVLEYQTHLDPKRFQKFIPTSYRQKLNFLALMSVPVSGFVYSKGLLVIAELILGKVNDFWRATILTFSLLSSFPTAHLINSVARYFFSERIEQKHLDEAFLELKNNPMFLNLFKKMWTEQDPFEIQPVEQSAFGAGFSRAQFCKSTEMSTIQIWNGKRSFWQILTNFYETYFPYCSQYNPVMWSSNPIDSLLFETINMLQNKAMLDLILQKENFSKKEYCVLVEYVEHQTLLAKEQIINYGVKYMDWNRNWLKKFSSYENLKITQKQFESFFKANWIFSTQKIMGYEAHVDQYALEWYEGWPILLDEKELSSTPADKNQSPEIGLFSFPVLELCGKVYFDSAFLESVDAHINYKQNQILIFIYQLLQDPEKITEQTLLDLPKDYKGRFLLHLVQDYLTDTKQDKQTLTVELFKKTLVALSKEKHRYAKMSWIMGE